jgi:hypothetical protein
VDVPAGGAAPPCAQENGMWLSPKPTKPGASQVPPIEALIAGWEFRVCGDPVYLNINWNVTKDNEVIPETIEVTLKEINSSTGNPTGTEHKAKQTEVERRGDLFVKYNCLPGCMKLVK